MRRFLRTDYRSFYLLNATQFLGALNDNLFKLLVVFLLINVIGQQHASSILAITGAVFVIPFLLFSSAAGVLADRISKRHILVSMKIAEVIIMAASMIAIYFQSLPFCYILLFIMATQSAIFGPSKYGIIPELVEQKRVSKANGTLNSFTYLAIITGTFLASFITEITNRNFLLVSASCVLVSIAGLAMSIGITKTPPRGSKKRVNPFFIYEIYQNLVISRKVPHLFQCTIGSAYFLFIGGFVQLNIIPFAIQSLGLSETGGGYLFLYTAIGIAIGSFFAGKLCKGHVEPSLSCLAGFALTILFFLLMLVCQSLTMAIILLVLLGVSGGIFLIPFDSFIQIYSPDKIRGQIIAVSNFLSFIGVLFAAGFLYLISDVLKYTAASGFGWMSLLTFLFTLTLTGRMADLFFPFLAQKILKKIYRIRENIHKPSGNPILYLQSGKWREAIYLYALYPKLEIITSGRTGRNFPWFHRFFNNISFIPLNKKKHVPYLKVIEEAQKLHEQKITVLIFLRTQHSKKELLKSFYQLFKNEESQLNFVEYRKEPSHHWIFPRKEVLTLFIPDNLTREQKFCPTNLQKNL